MQYIRRYPFVGKWMKDTWKLSAVYFPFMEPLCTVFLTSCKSAIISNI